MNSETERLLRQLERATSHARIDEELDEETQALREGWLALERLMRSPEQFRVLPPPQPHPARTQRTFYWVAAVSAVLLLAVLGGSVIVPKFGGYPIRSAVAHGEIEQGNRDQSYSSGVDRSIDRAAHDLGWDDSFDHRLAAASLVLRQAGEEVEVRHWQYLRGEFLEFSDELTRSSL